MYIYMAPNSAPGAPTLHNQAALAKQYLYKDEEIKYSHSRWIEHCSWLVQRR